MEPFDVVILGSGQGGKLLAWDLGRAGRRVAVVERRWVGGSCPAVACMPSKNEIFGAGVAHAVRNAERFGVRVDGFSVDMRRVVERKREMVEREIAAHLAAYAESGAELVIGEGRFVGERAVEVSLEDGGSRLLVGTEVVINVGTHAAMPDVPGLAEARPLTHVEILELDRLPEHLVVIGGGVVGVEMAQAFRRFGSRVTIIEPGPRLLRREDADVAAELLAVLTAEGVAVLTEARLVGVTGMSGDAVQVALDTPGGARTVEASDLLVATGRIANTSGIGLEVSGVTVDGRGFVRVNERLETEARGIWAIGECAGSPQFTHVSVDDFRIVRDNMAGGNRRTDERLVPNVTFTDPPLARVGLSEEEAERQGIGVRVARLPMARVLRTEATDETAGWMKAVVSAEDDRLLGFTMIGAGASEVVAAVQVAMLAALPYTALRDAVIAHLTFAEGLGPLLAAIPPRPTPQAAAELAWS